MIENKSIGSKVFDVVNVVILILITLVCRYGMSFAFP